MHVRADAAATVCGVAAADSATSSSLSALTSSSDTSQFVGLSGCAGYSSALTGSNVCVYKWKYISVCVYVCTHNTYSCDLICIARKANPEVRAVAAAT